MTDEPHASDAPKTPHGGDSSCCNHDHAAARGGGHGHGCGHGHHGHDHPHHEHRHSLENHPPLVIELRDHLPFSVSAVTIGLIVAGVMCVFFEKAELLVDEIRAILPASAIQPADDHAHDEHGHSHDDGHNHGAEADPPRLLFHLFHPAHMLFSAAATAAMFARYERKYFKAALVGFSGAVVVCGVSDIVMPHCSLWLLDYHPPLHLCILEHPAIVLPFAAIGVMVGLLASLGVSRSTLFSHSLHVFASTMASIFYMVGGIGIVAWIDRVGMVFGFVLAAVMVPCCLSDIVFPLAMSRKGRELYDQTPHTH